MSGKLFLLCKFTTIWGQNQTFSFKVIFREIWGRGKFHFWEFCNSSEFFCKRNTLSKKLQMQHEKSVTDNICLTNLKLSVMVTHMRGGFKIRFDWIQTDSMTSFLQAEEQLKLVEDQRRMLEEKQRMEDDERRRKKREQEVILNKKNARPKVSFSLGKWCRVCFVYS